MESIDPINLSVVYQSIKDSEISKFKEDIKQILEGKPQWEKYRGTEKWKGKANKANTELSIKYQNPMCNDKGYCNSEKTSDSFKSRIYTQFFERYPKNEDHIELLEFLEDTIPETRERYINTYHSYDSDKKTRFFNDEKFLLSTSDLEVLLHLIKIEVRERSLPPESLMLRLG
jgi:hypothetical protein